MFWFLVTTYNLKWENYKDKSNLLTLDQNLEAKL